MPYLFLILLFLSGCSIIQEQPSDQVTSTKTRLLKLDYEGFTLWLDCGKRGAIKFRYNAQRDNGNFKRSNRFYLDPNVPTNCQQTSTKGYGKGYDRGHLVPANHLDYSASAIKTSNTMTNSDSTHIFVEGGDDIISICGSRNVTIRNMRVHHAWTDGISVRRTYPIAPATAGIGCQQVVIENCEVYANARCNIAGHEIRHMRISDCRLHHGGLTGGVIAYSPACNIDIEPDPVMTDLSPADWSAETGTPSGLRFVTLENSEFVDANMRNVAVNVRFSHFIVRGCFFNNPNGDQHPCVFSVPHCSIQDSEIDTGTGRVDVALTGTLPGIQGGNVFTMERCLIRATSGEGLFVIAQVGRITQALIANCRFICEATVPTAKYFPYLATGQDMLMLTFRDNYTFIPSASYSGSGFKVCSTVAASLAENNVWETDYAGGGVNFLGVYYHTDASVYPGYPILVRNERFISPDGTGIRTLDASDHNNNLPFSGGISAIGDEVDLGKQRILYGGTSAPTSGLFSRGDLIFNNNIHAGESMGWVCVVEGTAGVNAVFKALPLVEA